MNLVQDPWLPFRLRNGSERVLPMTAICDPNVIDFALPRADFQGAAYQFAIGLLQTVFAPDDKYLWHDIYEQAPEPEVLQQAFDKAAHAFCATGDGPLFMQDFDELDAAKPTTVAGLLIEAPGANGLKLNTDHFIKRGIGSVMSLEMANIALFTLQINAPSGGQGHRTGLRGGGPLTTLVLPQHSNSSLWQKLWLNVINRDKWRYEDPDLHSGLVFPWLAKTKSSDKKGTEIYASDIHPLHMFWAMPRRICLEVQQGEAICQITGKLAMQTVTEYRTQNFGGNYSGSWQHPLTPYKWNPKKPEEEHLSAKGQQGGITYKIWDALTLTSNENGQQCAQVVNHYYSLCEGFADIQSQVPRLWVFGYDMDNMKARGWYSVSFPLFSVSTEQQEEILNEVKSLQKLAADSLWQCRTQIKTAWFDKPGDAKGDMSFIDLAFWQRSEAAFYNAVQHLIGNAVQGDPYLVATQANTWLKALRNTATDLFDEYALSELGSERSMAKRIKARQLLTGWLYGGKDIKTFIANHKIEQLKEVV
ncbi:type I-E CRISPR-associated protein Cse1/CasA [Alkalimarinus coralli]|uniref:type I-E CRISPR-associated protein Cse1/CasA n=1 Tax=Alkalimarinus coralli TaxID=2935863 RepID=UPI00202B72CB|nr:type I-E CRISPR-associated protein Cse1/CasA [Alkalimarinus coralli]